MKVTVLTGKSVCSSNPLNVKSEYGLSLFIEFDKRKLLFDTGQSDLFIHNAAKLGIDLAEVDYLIISHGHFDHGEDLKHFLKINAKAKIFLHINASHKFYTKIFGFFPYSVDPDQEIIAQNRRINFVGEDTQIEDKLIVLEGFPEDNLLALLLIENDEIVLFIGCSNSGITNIIEEVRLFSKSMRIKATFGSLPIGTGEIIEL